MILKKQHKRFKIAQFKTLKNSNAFISTTTTNSNFKKSTDVEISKILGVTNSNFNFNALNDSLKHISNSFKSITAMHSDFKVLAGVNASKILGVTDPNFNFNALNDSLKHISNSFKSITAMDSNFKVLAGVNASEILGVTDPNFSFNALNDSLKHISNSFKSITAMDLNFKVLAGVNASEILGIIDSNFNNFSELMFFNNQPVASTSPSLIATNERFQSIPAPISSNISNSILEVLDNLEAYNCVCPKECVAKKNSIKSLVSREKPLSLAQVMNITMCIISIITFIIYIISSIKGLTSNEHDEILNLLNKNFTATDEFNGHLSNIESAIDELIEYLTNTLDE